MARKPRIWYPGAIYHVMSRGNRRGALFKDRDDRISFLEYVQKTRKKHPFKIHSICLMDNHFHMLLETQNDSLSLIMKKILQLHASEFNNKYHLNGHVFEDRFVSSLIEDEPYFLEVSRYIHLNPVKAQMVLSPQDYIYSSYNLFVPDRTNQEDPAKQIIKGIVDTDRVMEYFGGDQEQYRMFVEGEQSHTEQENQIQKEMREDEMWLPRIVEGA